MRLFIPSQICAFEWLNFIANEPHLAANCYMQEKFNFLQSFSSSLNECEWKRKWMLKCFMLFSMPLQKIIWTKHQHFVLSKEKTPFILNIKFMGSSEFFLTPLKCEIIKQRKNKAVDFFYDFVFKMFFIEIGLLLYCTHISAFYRSWTLFAIMLCWFQTHISF